jgi:hypothetical protein
VIDHRNGGERGSIMLRGACTRGRAGGPGTATCVGARIVWTQVRLRLPDLECLWREECLMEQVRELGRN